MEAFQPCWISVKDVYGIDNPPIPAGMVGVKFRPFKANERYLTTSYDVSKSDRDSSGSPRIILEDKPKRQVLVYEYDVVPDSEFNYGKCQVKKSAVAGHIWDGYGRAHIEERD